MSDNVDFKARHTTRICQTLPTIILWKCKFIFTTLKEGQVATRQIHMTACNLNGIWLIGRQLRGVTTTTIFYIHTLRKERHKHSMCINIVSDVQYEKLIIKLTWRAHNKHQPMPNVDHKKLAQNSQLNKERWRIGTT